MNRGLSCRIRSGRERESCFDRKTGVPAARPGLLLSPVTGGRSESLQKRDFALLRLAIQSCDETECPVMAGGGICGSIGIG